VIPGTRDQSSSSLDQLLDVLNAPTRAAMASSLLQTGIGVAGHGGDLRDLLHSAPQLLPEAQQVAAAVSSPQADLPALLRSADQLAGRFTGTEQQISQLIQQTDSTLRAIGVDGGAPLEHVLTDLPPTLRQTQVALDHLNQPLVDAQSALSTLRPGAVALGASTADLRGVLREAVPPVGAIPGVATVATPAVDALTQAFADARPLVPQLTTALADAMAPLRVLAAYTPDIAQFFAQKSMLQDHIGDNHWLRIGVVLPPPQAELGILGPFAPTVPRDPYPAPGQARNETTNAPLSLGGGH
jgi:phospholipid/cholesterol/gamma-HCH transport system substrate-binding protein